MGYNAVDIISKTIIIAEKKREIFRKIKEENTNNISTRIVVDVLLGEIEKTLEYYKGLKEETSQSIGDEIDFVIYDKISFLVNQFNGRIYVPEISDVKELLQFSLDCERQVYGLMVDIQGRLVKSERDVSTKPYRVMSAIIDRKAREVEDIEKNIR